MIEKCLRLRGGAIVAPCASRFKRNANNFGYLFKQPLSQFGQHL